MIKNQSASQSMFWIRRFYWRALRALGLQRMSWDGQYEAGIWSNPRSPVVIQWVKTLCGGGAIIEFGCGEGTLPLAMTAGAFEMYRGYDISKVAVERARKRAHEERRGDVQFLEGDMAQWTGATGVSLIVIEECLYYLKAPDVEIFLRRCCESLNSNGKILVVVHSQKHARLLDTCRRVCKVADEARIGGRTYLVLSKV